MTSLKCCIEDISHSIETDMKDTLFVISKLLSKFSFFSNHNSKIRYERIASSHCANYFNLIGIKRKAMRFICIKHYLFSRLIQGMLFVETFILFYEALGMALLQS